MAPTRIACAVLLTRGSGEALEVFLAKRAPELSFFGGYLAFLGGVVDEADHDGEADVLPALFRCAWRELFEEAGVLPAGLSALIPEMERVALRARLMARDEQASLAAGEFREYLDRCPELSAPDSAAAPQVIGRLTTPPFAPVLYRTLFVRIELPAGQEASVMQGELVQGSFVQPSKAMQGWLAGELCIVPPAVYFLSELARFEESQAWERLAQACRACSAGKLHEIRTVPGIWMIPLATETIPPATTTNAYWVGSESAYLIDPASFDPAEQARLFDFVDERLAQGLKLAGVIATHHHHDHIGAIVPVAKRYGVPVLAHRETLDRLDLDGCETRELRDADELYLGPPVDAAGRPGEPGAEPWSLRAYHTPGHDRGHLVLLENGCNAALVGDLCSTVSTIVIDPPEGHMGTYLKSLERMLQVPMGVLHPAHGPVHPDGHTLLRAYLEHRKQREQRLLAQLQAQPLELAELARSVYDDVLPALMPLALRSLLAGLHKLRDEGLALEDEGAWRLSMEPPA